MNEEKVLEQLRRFLKPQDCFGPVPQSQIDHAERVLGVSFPFSYRVFLRYFGASLAFPPYEIAGLPATRRSDVETPLWSNVIDDTEMTRRASRGYIPHPYIAFSSDGADCTYYLDTALVDQEGESPVVALGPGHDADVVAASFAEFVARVAAGHSLDGAQP